MRIVQTLAIVSSLVLGAGCASEHRPVSYVTPSGQVISTGPDGRTAADCAARAGGRGDLRPVGRAVTKLRIEKASRPSISFKPGETCSGERASYGGPGTRPNFRGQDSRAKQRAKGIKKAET